MDQRKRFKLPIVSNRNFKLPDRQKPLVFLFQFIEYFLRKWEKLQINGKFKLSRIVCKIISIQWLLLLLLFFITIKIVIFNYTKWSLFLSFYSKCSLFGLICTRDMLEIRWEPYNEELLSSVRMEGEMECPGTIASALQLFRSSRQNVRSDVRPRGVHRKADQERCISDTVIMSSDCTDPIIHWSEVLTSMDVTQSGTSSGLDRFVVVTDDRELTSLERPCTHTHIWRSPDIKSRRLFTCMLI